MTGERRSDSCDCSCHEVIRPGLVPCPWCEPFNESLVPGPVPAHGCLPSLEPPVAKVVGHPEPGDQDNTEPRAETGAP